MTAAKKHHFVPQFLLKHFARAGASQVHVFDKLALFRNFDDTTGKARWWGTTLEGMSRVSKADRLHEGGSTISFVRFLDDFSVKPITNYWRDVILSSRVEDKVYVVQTSVKLIQRCILLSTDPGDLVLDPTCGSGTTAHCACT